MSRLLLEGHLGTPQGPYLHVEVNAKEHARRVRVFKATLRAAGAMVMPVYRKEPRRFTLLVLRKTPQASELDVTLRYFDYLAVPHRGCQENAQALLKILEVPQPLPLRHNSARQVGSDCGFMTCHYLEEHMRCAAGQGFATQGWPEGPQMRCIRKPRSDHSGTGEGKGEVGGGPGLGGSAQGVQEGSSCS